MFGFFKRKIQMAAVKAATEDLSRFKAGLVGMTKEELGQLVALAHLMGSKLAREGVLPQLDDDFLANCDLMGQESIDKEPMLAMGNIIRIYQKENMNQSALGIMVWLHSLRAVVYPEIRQLGREMWVELARGFPYASEQLANLLEHEKNYDESLGENLDYVPPELLPNK